ncbi:hypothetical protein ABW19_dt0200588 [Dactylella cylindrospora]|nr:hypothetical protein ABW19_dt0200588 [Dactylella cylindrospora]
MCSLSCRHSTIFSKRNASSVVTLFFSGLAKGVYLFTARAGSIVHYIVHSKKSGRLEEEIMLIFSLERSFCDALPFFNAGRQLFSARLDFNVSGYQRDIGSYNSTAFLVSQSRLPIP